MNALTLAARPYVRLQDMLNSMSDGKRARVHELMSAASGYAWGFNDAGGVAVDSFQFSLIYGLRAARFETERMSSRPPIQDVFRHILTVRSDVSTV